MNTMCLGGQALVVHVAPGQAPGFPACRPLPAGSAYRAAVTSESEQPTARGILHPWIDPDDVNPADPRPGDPRDIGMAVVDDDGLMVGLDSDDPEDRALYEHVILSHPEDCPDCPGRR
jgi:hypothetical protein